VKLAAANEEAIVSSASLSLSRDMSSSSAFDASVGSHRGGGDAESALMAAASAGGAPMEVNSSSVETGGGSGPTGGGRGAMDAAAEDNGADQKDRWRKVFLNLRKNLKPREPAVSPACPCVMLLVVDPGD
jgi:hypothetical protein